MAVRPVGGERPDLVMIGENDTRLHELFEQAVVLPAHERSGFLDSACGGDTELRLRLEKLLAWDTAAGTFLERGVLVRPELSERAGDRIGPYRLVRQIGEGGMAVVWLARQSEPVHRHVALKIVKPGMDTRSILARFELERHVLAHLNHPHVASVLDAGMSEQGRPYFVMDYVDGQVFTRYCDTHQLATPARLRLFVQVCYAVRHAHQKGIVHRDIKPSNILISTHGDEPAPRVIDFGIAKATAGELHPGTNFTEHGQLIGTPEYMSPEQCDARAGDLDVRSDVYSLGVVLYELLCGRIPYDLSGVASFDVPRVIRERSAVRPATVDRRLAGDLETIVLKALEKDREDRYQSAADLARDIERFLDRQPIEARPRSMAYHVWMFTRRHRTLVGAGAVMVLTLIAAVIVSVAFAAEAGRESIRRGNAEHQATIERDAAIYRLYVAGIAAAEASFRSNQFERLQNHLRGAPVEHRGWEWRYLSAQADASDYTIEHPVMVDGLALSPDDTILLSGGRDGVVRWWDARDGTPVRVVPSHDGQILAIAFSPDGRTYATCSSDRSVAMWDAASGERVWSRTDHRRTVMQVVFTPDGAHVLSASDDGTVRAWRADDGTPVWQTELGHDLQTVAVSPDGKTAATGDEGGNLTILEAREGHVMNEVHAFDGIVRRVSFSPDGRHLIASAQAHDVSLWRVDSLTKERAHPFGQWGAVFSPDGSWFAVGDPSPSFFVRLVEAAGGDMIGALPGHADTPYSLVVNSDGSRLYSGSWDRTVRAWNVEDIATPRLTAPSQVTDVAFSPEGRLIGVVVDEQAVLLCDSSTLDILRTIALPDHEPQSIAFDPAGGHLAVGWTHGLITILDARTGDHVADLDEHTDSVRSLAYAPDGARLVSGSNDGTAVIWDAHARSPLHRLDGAGRVYAVAFGPYDRVAVVNVESSGVPRLFDASTGRLVADLIGHSSRAYAAAFSHDGELLATGSRDQTVRIWRARDGAEVTSIRGHGQFVTDLDFSPDDSRLAGASFFRTLTLWDGTTFDTLLNLEVHDAAIPAIDFAPDGTRIATGSLDATLQVWDASARQHIGAKRRSALARIARDDETIDRLLDELGDADAVADRIEADPALDRSARHALLNALLRR